MADDTTGSDTIYPIPSGYTRWAGGDCPVDPETTVIVQFRDGLSTRAIKANKLWWHHKPQNDDIVAYRTLP